MQNAQITKIQNWDFMLSKSSQCVESPGYEIGESAGYNHT